MVNVFNSIRATPLRRAGSRQGRGTALRNDHAIQMKVRRGFEPVSEVSHGEERRNRVGGPALSGWADDGRRSKTDFSIMLATKEASMAKMKGEK